MSSGAWDLTDDVPIRITVRDESGARVNAGSVTIESAFKPDGTAVSPLPTFSNTSTGVYEAEFTAVDQAGLWFGNAKITGVVPDDRKPFSFFVGDPVEPVYLDLESFKKALSDVPDAIENKGALLERALRAASRKIDDECHRFFYQKPSATAAVYKASGNSFQNDDGTWTLLTDDIAAASGVIVEIGNGFGGTWTTLDSAAYELSPLDALGKKRPATGITVVGRWPSRLVRVTARWGWPRVPDAVESATQLLAARYYNRRTSPEGIAGSAEFGGVVRLSRSDPDAYDMIKGLIKPLS